MTRRLIFWACVILGTLAIVIAVSALLNGMWSWLPWSAESRLARTEQRADTAEADASARGLEAEGEVALAQRVETFHTQEVVIRDLTAQTVTEARSAPDATDPLDPDRLARLRAGDARLCAVSPDACAGSAPAPVDP